MAKMWQSRELVGEIKYAHECDCLLSFVAAGVNGNSNGNNNIYGTNGNENGNGNSNGGFNGNNNGNGNIGGVNRNGNGNNNDGGRRKWYEMQSQLL